MTAVTSKLADCSKLTGTAIAALKDAAESVPKCKHQEDLRRAFRHAEEWLVEIRKTLEPFVRGNPK